MQFNVREGECSLKDFMEEFHAKHLVKEETCFKNIENPSCIDLFLTNSYQSFQNTTAVSTVLKLTFLKAEPKVIVYMDFSKFAKDDFKTKLNTNILANGVNDYDTLETNILSLYNTLALLKKKVVRANHKPYVTKNLPKAIMTRSSLEGKFYKYRSEECREAVRKQKNYCNRLSKREKREYYSRLNLNNITDIKKFWKTMQPFFNNKGGGNEKIVLVEGDKIISNDTDVAQTFNHFFKNSVTSLNISENRFLLKESEIIYKGAEGAIRKFEIHPSIQSIHEKVTTDSRFPFSKVTASNMKLEMKSLNPKKVGTFMGISSKLVIDACDVLCEPLSNIWNDEIKRKKFPSKLKLADISSFFKKMEDVLVGNYRPISILPTISKIFERIMQMQVNEFVEIFLSPFLCGYRKRFNSQYALLVMIEKWKTSLDNHEFAANILMDLSKTFDTIN